MRNYRRLAVMSIISINFRMKIQERCKSDEVSIYRISDPDILYLHKEIKTLSGWDTDADKFKYFLQTLKNKKTSVESLNFAIIFKKSRDNLGNDFYPTASTTFKLAIKALAANKAAAYELAEAKKRETKRKK